ncbi:MAG: PEPxxWA-CTERM sorting domain-containing protein [Novosphingobium sp.]
MTLGIFIARLLAAAALGSASIASAATLIVSGGILQGATDVDVNGAMYDVRFVDGTCQALFSGCDEDADFIFRTKETARAAAQALLDQVLIDGPAGNFDSVPQLTAGCIDTYGFCLTIIPYKITHPGRTAATAAVWLENFVTSGGDVIYDSIGAGTEDTAKFKFKNYVQFTPHYPPIPEPATWVTMIVGFGLVGTAMRRRPAGRPAQAA